MWNRWNQTTHIWERSVDNGNSWTPLPNVAYKNQDNNFVPQTLGSGTVIQGDGSLFYFYEPGAPVDRKRWRFVNYKAGDIRIELLNDLGASILATPLILGPSGNINVGQHIVAAQSIFAGGSFYELNRSTALGYWINVPYSAANFSAESGMTITTNVNMIPINKYTLIGKTLHWAVNINGFTLGGTTNANVLLKLPGGLVSNVDGSIGTFIFTNQLSGVSWKVGSISASSGNPNITLTQLPNFVWTPGDSNNWAFVNITMQVQ